MLFRSLHCVRVVVCVEHKRHSLNVTEYFSWFVCLGLLEMADMHWMHLSVWVTRVCVCVCVRACVCVLTKHMSITSSTRGQKSSAVRLLSTPVAKEHTHTHSTKKHSTKGYSRRQPTKDHWKLVEPSGSTSLCPQRRKYRHQLLFSILTDLFLSISDIFAFNICDCS